MSSEKKNKIRGYDNVYVLCNVSNDVMLLGYPLKLAVFYVLSIFLCFIIVIFLNSAGFPLYVTISVALIELIGGITAVKIFYKKYGVNGFELSQRDKNLMNDIEGNISVLDEIRKRIEKNKE